MPDTPIWLTKLREVGVTASDTDALAAALDSVTDPQVIRTVIRLDLDDLLPASCDRPLGVLVGTPGPWEDVFNEEMLRMAAEFRAWRTGSTRLRAAFTRGSTGPVSPPPASLQRTSHTCHRDSPAESGRSLTARRVLLSAANDSPRESPPTRSCV